MTDFAEGISDDPAGQRLARAIQGRGAFRRFKDALHEEYPALLEALYASRDIRLPRRPRRAPRRPVAALMTPWSQEAPASTSSTIPSRPCRDRAHGTVT